jgi:serine/threonine protein phosphatase 1
LPSRTLVFGDVHGCLSNFDALLYAVAPTPSDRIILLGDLIDRGPDSAGVLTRVLRVSQSHDLTTLMGNHEQMMLAARNGHDKFSDWLRNGGDATLRSYAGARATLNDIAPEHWQFLEHELVSYFETDAHIFVHAGAHPDMAMFEQPDYVLRWERCDNIRPHSSGKVIVCGHTPQTSGCPLNLAYAICIDTNACGGGQLTCLEVESGRLWQADAAGRVTRAHISDFSGE